MREIMLGVLSLLLVLSLCHARTLSRIQQPQAPTPDPDCFYNITQMIASKGYPFEEHKVITPDGYILGVYRIPHGRNTLSATPGRPVLLQHGLLDSGTTWVMDFPGQSLGYILADAGYDVWIGNVRGNRYSRAHVKYDPRHDEIFWDFSWDEMAHIDLPSMIYYILNVTQQTHIGYVGHSQGTMMGFSEFGRPDSVLQNSVSFWAALAPVAHLGHIKSPLRYLSSATMQKDLELYWHLLFGRNEFLPSDSILRWLGTYACGEVIVDKVFCANIYFILFGPDKKNINATRSAVYASHVPDGTSVKNMIHFAQGVQSNLFEEYDYGTPEKNQQHYNQTIPPAYSLRGITVPTAIFSGGEDWLADPTDADYIYDNIDPKTLVFRKTIPNYNHMDFVWGLSANNLIYTDLLNQMQKYHPPN
jgi:pimeloyl-ACP methyl ester carboxylesterase